MLLCFLFACRLEIASWCWTSPFEVPRRKRQYDQYREYYDPNKLNAHLISPFFLCHAIYLHRRFMMGEIKERKRGKKHASVLMDIVALCQTMIGYQQNLSFLLKGFFIVSPVPKSTSGARTTTQLDHMPRKPALLRLPRNVYILLIFTLGKGFQLTIAALTLNYYVHSLGYRPDFIGVFSAVPAIGSLISALPVGRLADRIGRKPVLLLTAVLSPLFLALCALATSAPLLLLLAFIQGLCSTGYWVTIPPLLVESTTERQRVGVLAMNSFLLLGIGALGNLLGGTVPELVAAILHVSAASTLPLRWGVFTASAFTFVFGIPLWLLREPQRAGNTARYLWNIRSLCNASIAKTRPAKIEKPLAHVAVPATLAA